MCGHRPVRNDPKTTEMVCRSAPAARSLQTENHTGKPMRYVERIVYMYSRVARNPGPGQKDQGTQITPDASASCAIRKHSLKAQANLSLRHLHCPLKSHCGGDCVYARDAAALDDRGLSVAHRPR